MAVSFPSRATRRIARALLVALVVWMPAAHGQPLDDDAADWLAENGALRVAVHPTSPGLSENGASGIQGAYIDLLQLAALGLDVDLELVAVPDLEAALAAVARGDAHLAGPISAARVVAEGGAASTPFFATAIILVTNVGHRDLVRVEDLDGLRVGLRPGSAAQGVVLERAPGAQVVLMDDLRQGVLDLVHGDLDALMGDKAHIGGATQLYGLQNRTFVVEELARSDIVAYAPAAAVALAILDDGLGRLSQDTVRLTTIKWTGFDLSIAPTAPGVPTWLFQALWASLGMAGLLVGVVLASRWQVRRATGELARLNETLEDRVGQRTREAEAARIVAEQASSARAVFVANMSHEIRTPLNAILGMVNILAEEELGTNQDRVQVIRSSGKHLLGVINDILDLTKIDAGQIELDEQPVEVARVVGEACDLIAAEARQKGLHLVNDLRDVPLAVLADAGRLRQIIVNLLSNAVKFTAEGEVRITTSVEDDNLVFEVRDTGPGIPVAHQEAIWEAFEQGDMTTTRQQGGTGLGLTITKRLVALMGGSIALSSSHLGTTFTVKVPCRPTTPGIDPSDGDMGRSLAGKVVLLVDDDEVNTEILSHQLQQWKMDVIATRDADEALSVVRQSPLDAVILDLHMPGVDGASLARAIHTLRPLLPLLMFSAGDVVGEDRSLFHAEIAKPPAAPDLYRQLTPLVAATGAPARRVFDPDLAGRFPCRILVAEDNPFNQVVAMDLLRQFGYHPDLAVDGADAVRKAPGHDLIFMDIQMPHVDGFAATRAIREAGHDVRIIGLSAHVGPAERRACKEAGMDGFMSKPIAVPTLRRFLEDCGTAKHP